MSQPRILVVDDNPQVLTFLGDFLKDQDFTVQLAATGEEALEAGRSADFDVAIVDYKLPGIDGLQTIEELSKIAPDLVTIIMTGFPTLDSSIKAIRLGASDYILKPFKLEEISISLKRAVRERALRLEIRQLKKRTSNFESNIGGLRDEIKINKNIGSGKGSSSIYRGSPGEKRSQEINPNANVDNQGDSR